MKIIKLVLSAALLLATPSMADTVLIGGGVKGGGYDSQARVLATKLQQRGVEAEVQNYNGSEDITLAACQEKIQVWIAQIDAIYAAQKAGCNLRPTGIYGKELAVLMLPPKPKVWTLREFSDNYVLNVGAIGSGTSLFWETILKNERAEKGERAAQWTSVQTSNLSVSELITAGELGSIDGAILIQKNNSDVFRKLLEAGWSFGELWDKGISNIEYRDLPLYGEVKTRVLGKKFWGYEVRSFIGVSPKASSDLQQLLGGL